MTAHACNAFCTDDIHAEIDYACEPMTHTQARDEVAGRYTNSKDDGSYRRIVDILPAMEAPEAPPHYGDYRYPWLLLFAYAEGEP